MKHSFDDFKIMAIAALSFRVFSSFLLLARVGNENMSFEHEGNHKISVSAPAIIEIS
jgi:hypothetical protein